MKSKLFAKLKREYSPLGLGDDVLMSRAESLAALGLVTDDNIDAVVAVQRNDLEAMQARTDKRVTDAIEKERKKQEEETRRKEADAKKAAEEAAAKKAAEEAEARKAAEEAEALKKEKQKKDAEEADEAAKREAELARLKESGVADNVLEYLKSLHSKTDADRKAEVENALKREAELDKRLQAILAAAQLQQEQNLKALEALTAQHTTLKADYDTLKAENEAAKLAKAANERRNFIESKARELGVPQWRIDEGFKLEDNASDETITEALSKVANNIRTGMLPGSAKMAYPASDTKPTSDEIAAFAKSIVK